QLRIASVGERTKVSTLQHLHMKMTDYVCTHKRLIVFSHQFSHRRYGPVTGAIQAGCTGRLVLLWILSVVSSSERSQILAPLRAPQRKKVSPWDF
ncbi:MAG: hypothetical protein ACLUD2_21695, partial [Clostridium sp.]